MQLLYDPVIMSLGFYSREMKTYIHTNSVHRCSWQIYLWQPQTRNNPDALQWSEWVNKLWYIPIMKYISKKNILLTYATTWMSLQRTMLNEKKQMPKGYILLDAIYIFLKWQNFTNVYQWLPGFMKGRRAGGNWMWQ